MLECPKCHYDNDLGRIFCAKCGEKLDITKIAPPSSVKRKKPGGKYRAVPVEDAVRGFVFKVIKVFFLSFTSAFILAVSLPNDLPTPKMYEDGLEVFAQKRLQFDSAVQNKGEESTIVFTEADINAALSEMVRNASQGEESLNRFLVERIYLVLEDGYLVLDIHTKWKWFRWGFQIESRVVQKNDQWQFVVRAVRIGNWSVPAYFGLMDRVSEKFGALFAGMESERKSIEGLKSIQIKKGELELITKKGE